MNAHALGTVILLALVWGSGAFAQQPATKEDLQTLEFKLTTTITEMDKRLTKQIQELENRLTKQMTELDKRLSGQIADLDKRITSLEIRVDELDKRLTNRIDELDKRLTAKIDVLFWAIGALIAVVLAVIAVPQFLGFFQEKRGRAEILTQLEEIRVQMQRQQQKIDELKAQRIVSPGN